MSFPIKFLTRTGGAGAVDRKLAGLANVLGLYVGTLELPKDYAVGDSFLTELVGTQALVCSAETLADLLNRNIAGLAGFDSLVSHLRFLLIYGLEHCSSDSARLLFGADLIAETSPSVPSANHCYVLPQAGSAVSLQLAGISFEAARGNGSASPPAGEANCVSRFIGGSTTPIIDCDGVPFFATLRRRDCEVFLLGSSALLDVNSSAAKGELPRQAYPALLPWLFFMRRAADERFWSNPAPKACLIIDDPLLRPRYGFLSFEALVESMRRSDFTTTIAFIPWNCARSEVVTSALFRQNPSVLSLCVHGCDHTGGEFGSTDIAALRQQARAGLERMRLHEQTTRIACDRVMVFPQGVFSSASLLALEREGYLAAVNSGLSSIDHPELNRVADLLVPASKSYAGVPLFKRHYPGELLPFALDLFLGKQVLIVEHHTYFRSGYHQAAAFAAQLNAIEQRLTWAPLGETLRSAVQQRVTASGSELRAYTDEVLFRPAGNKSEQYRLIKYETDPASVSAVMVNGRAAEYQLREDRVELEFEARDECRIDVLRRPSAPFTARVPSLGYKVGVAARRYLCELRDEALVGKARLLSTPIARRFSRAGH